MQQRACLRLPQQRAEPGNHHALGDEANRRHRDMHLPGEYWCQERQQQQQAAALAHGGGYQHACDKQRQLNQDHRRHRERLEIARQRPARRKAGHHYREGGGEKAPAHHQQHNEREQHVELHFQPDAPVRQYRAERIIRNSAEDKRNMRENIAGGRIGIALAFGLR